MKAATYRLRMTEDEFAKTILPLAHLHHWLCMHQRPARTNKGWRTLIQGDPGFPDWVFARDGEVLFVEQKSDHGRLTPEQQQWKSHLPNHDVWRPSDLEQIKAILSKPRRNGATP